MEIGLLIIRVVVGALLVGHGSQKLFGWFGGYGLKGTGAYMESFGLRPGPLLRLRGRRRRADRRSRSSALAC